MEKKRMTTQSKCVLLLAISALVAGLMQLRNQPEPDFAQTKPLQVVTSFTIIADMAQTIAGDAAQVRAITKPGAEIHNYQPTPQDIVRAKTADLILWNGMNLELWFERFTQDVGDIPSVIVSTGIDPLSIQAGPYTNAPNPHAWMSTTAALVYIANIRDALSQHDPANAAQYHQNAEAYAEAVRTIRKKLTATLATIPEENRYLVTSEGAFSYLAQDLGMTEVYIWPMNADQNGTPQQVRAVIDAVRAHAIPVVFSESTVSDKPAKQIAAETSAHYGGVLYVDSLSTADGPVPTYLDLLTVTTSTIARGFKTALAQ
jgi:manganese/iron transport system substrate-binding protein